MTPAEPLRLSALERCERVIGSGTARECESRSIPGPCTSRPVPWFQLLPVATNLRPVPLARGRRCGVPDGTELPLEPDQHPAALAYKAARRQGRAVHSAAVEMGPVVTAVFHDTCGNLV